MLFKMNYLNKIKGFTLIETLVGIGVFLVIAVSSYQAYVSLFLLINQNQYKILALNLANEQFEIIRNLTYADVGIVGGVPNGKVPNVQNLNRSGVDFVVTTTIRNVDLPFDGTIGGSPNDLSPADNKFVEVNVDCPSCKNFSTVVLNTTVAPKNLETASTNGALFIKVFDANGVPIQGASVHIENNKINPKITIDDITDANGLLQIIDAPPGVEAYEITVTKTGYSTDKTLASGQVSNPYPAKTHATVVLQQVTQVSFSIDKLSSISFKSTTPSCTIVPNIDFNLTGSKQIGTNVSKYNQNISTNASGVYTNNSMEWDTYKVTGNDSSYDIVGINPLNPIGLNPDSNQNVSLIVINKDPRSLLVTVKDSATLLPVTDAVVTLSKDGYNNTQTTDRGFITQTDWSHGEGVDYTVQDGNIEISDPVGELKLKNVFGVYNASGIIESSTFDTGSNSNFHNLIWLPSDEPVSAGPNSVRFQIATNVEITATTTWSYTGPDGTSGTYYTVSNTPISNDHDGHRYIRYKLYLSTADTSVTPNISDVSFTMTTSCTPPGQVVFTNLDSGEYTLSVIKSGYSASSNNIEINSNWKEQEVILMP